MSKDNGGPAFPLTRHRCDRGHSWVEVYGGLTMRDYFAAKALTGLIAVALSPADTALFAYQYADAMLKERTRHDREGT